MAETPIPERAALDHMLLSSQNQTLVQLASMEKTLKSLAQMLKTIVTLLETKAAPPATPMASYDQLYGPVDDEEATDIHLLPADPLPTLPPPTGWRRIWQRKGRG